MATTLFSGDLHNIVRREHQTVPDPEITAVSAYSVLLAANQAAGNSLPRASASTGNCAVTHYVPSRRSYSELVMLHRDNICVCRTRKATLAQHLGLKFTPSSLRQTLLLRLGYHIYSQKHESKISRMSIPQTVQDILEKIVEELRVWHSAHYPFLSHACECFLPYLHWEADFTINYPQSAELIMLNNRLGKDQRFCTGAYACSSPNLSAFWSQHNTGHHSILRVRGDIENRVVAYWFKLLKHGSNAQPPDLLELTRHAFCYSISEGLPMYTVRFFYDKLDAQLPAADMQRIVEEMMYAAVQGNFPHHVRFLWSQVPNAKSRETILTKFELVKHAQDLKRQPLVLFMWNQIDALTQHKLFLLYSCKHQLDEWLLVALRLGNIELVRDIWIGLSGDQKQNLLFRDDCSALNFCCQCGLIDVLKMFFEHASFEQKLRISSVVGGSTLEFLKQLWDPIHIIQKDAFLYHDDCRLLREFTANNAFPALNFVWESVSIPCQQEILNIGLFNLLGTAIQKERYYMADFWLSKVSFEQANETILEKDAKILKMLLEGPVSYLSCIDPNTVEGRVKLFRKVYANFREGQVLEFARTLVCVSTWYTFLQLQEHGDILCREFSKESGVDIIHDDEGEGGPWSDYEYDDDYVYGDDD